LDLAQLLVGDCREQLRSLLDASIDAIVTDPPYELGFMGKAWDAAGIAYDVSLWVECLRVLKPGGHLLAFGGTRTYHRMAVAIEDAGFEIRDSIHWLYGSGFPKSLDVSKAIDKRGGIVPWQADFAAHLRSVRPKDVSAAAINAHVANGSKSNFWGHFIDTTSQPLLPTVEQYRRLREVLPIDPSWDACFLPEAEREVVGKTDATVLAVAPGEGRDRPPVELDITAPATDAAKQWSGWGTALKPSHEPILVARKPLVGTVAANVLAHGTGALNIDGARVAAPDAAGKVWTRGGNQVGSSLRTNTSGAHEYIAANPGGRWPANLVFTHAADCGDECAPGCPVAELDAQSGVSKSPAKVTRGAQRTGNSGLGQLGRQEDVPCHDDSGGASRFFTVTEWDPITDVPFRYVAKPSRAQRNAGLDGLPERNRYKAGGVGGTGGLRDVDKAVNATPVANHHPTVKPVALMRWLVRLVTPPGGTVLDPFLGSGTTAVAAILEGFEWKGCEMTTDYLPIIEGRVAWAIDRRASDTRQLVLVH